MPVILGLRERCSFKTYTESSANQSTEKILDCFFKILLTGNVYAPWGGAAKNLDYLEVVHVLIPRARSST